MSKVLPSPLCRLLDLIDDLFRHLGIRLQVLDRRKRALRKLRVAVAEPAAALLDDAAGERRVENRPLARNSARVKNALLNV